MAKVLVFAEQRAGKLKRVALELISFHKEAGFEVHAALLGPGATETLAKELGNAGAKTVHTNTDASLEHYNGERYALTLKTLIEHCQPDLVVTGHTPMGRDLLPRLAAQMDRAIVTDCTSLKYEGEQARVRRPMYAGKATCEAELLGPKPHFLTIRANALGMRAASAENVVTEALTTPDFSTLTSNTTAIQQGESQRLDVTEAPIVISGGRSLKNAENFKLLEDFADAVGGAVGASRAAVDAGFRPHRDQVGQTGKVVSPQLYIACGISGAIQHLAGMRSSKTIVAINTDPSAPIFQVADISIVGDLFEVVPELTKAAQAVREHT